MGTTLLMLLGLLVLGLLAGSVLARLNVYILIPASAATTAIVLLNGFAAGKGVLWFVVATVVTAAFLEIGYLLGTAALLAVGGSRFAASSEFRRSSRGSPRLALPPK